MFIIIVSLNWLIWAERQKSNLRQLIYKVILDSLIEDLTDEACTKDKGTGVTGGVIYGRKDAKDDKEGKSKKTKDKKTKEDRPKYPYYKMPKPKYKPEDCLEYNDEKRKE